MCDDVIFDLIFLNLLYLFLWNKVLFKEEIWVIYYLVNMVYILKEENRERVFRKKVLVKILGVWKYMFGI